MGSARVPVIIPYKYPSPIIRWIIVASFLAMATALSEVECNPSGAVGWPLINTNDTQRTPMLRFFPLITAARRAIGGTAPFSVINPESGAATVAWVRFFNAQITAPPLRPLAAVRGLVVMREEEDWEE